MQSVNISLREPVTQVDFRHKISWKYRQHIYATYCLVKVFLLSFLGMLRYLLLNKHCSRAKSQSGLSWTCGIFCREQTCQKFPVDRPQRNRHLGKAQLLMESNIGKDSKWNLVTWTGLIWLAGWQTIVNA